VISASSDQAGKAGKDGANSSTPEGFGGLRVVYFESRLATECGTLVEKSGGIAISAPAMREVELSDNGPAISFAGQLVAGHVDAVVFLTGVGTRHLFAAMETVHQRDELVAALKETTVAVRGPKPLRALGELGVRVDLRAEEPNTWQEVLAAFDANQSTFSLEGKTVAVQEYGVGSPQLASGLAERGATPLNVAVYRWATPENTRPLLDGLREIISGTADVLLFTSSMQARNVIKIASAAGIVDHLRQALKEVVVASIGPVCSQTLDELGIPVDVQPARGKLGALVKAASEQALPLLEQRRRQAVPGPPPTVGRREFASDDPEQSLFMRACRREPVERVPVWLMRQAGRYMREYRELRARTPFMDLCKNPGLSSEVAVTAAARLGVDAAILFSDILLIVEPMGLGLTYNRGDGPRLQHVVRDASDVDRLLEVDPNESLPFVMDAIKRTRSELPAGLPLIGFSGAPFTLASYIIEGGGSRNYTHTKRLMHSDRGAWDAMMELISRSVARYLSAQIEAGVQAVQLFDSWVGCLSPDEYREFVLPHTRSVFDALPPSTPSLHFGTGTSALLDLQVEAGGSVLGIDHRSDLAEASRRFTNLALQGNMDPAILFAGPEAVRSACRAVLTAVGDRDGFIFNLGHGVLPGTPVDNVIALVDAVHELGLRD